MMKAACSALKKYASLCCAAVAVFCLHQADLFSPPGRFNDTDFSAGSLLLAPEQEQLFLRNSVDSLALGFEGICAAEADFEQNKVTLGAALDSLSFASGQQAYFSLWEQDTLIYSPLNPDLSGVDFSSNEQIGIEFLCIRELVKRSVSGAGGFIQLGRSVCAEQETAYYAYVKHIHGTNWHILALLPGCDLKNSLEHLRQKDAERLGLCSLGLSLLGVAGLGLIYKKQSDYPGEG